MCHEGALSNRRIAPHNLSLSDRGKEAVSFTFRRCAARIEHVARTGLYLGGLQSRNRCCGKEKISYPGKPLLGWAVSRPNFEYFIS
jgi:hypothetical protein